MVNGNNEKKFMNYLASQVSPTLIAEFSSYYADIEAFCLRLNILKKPLFDTTDFETIKSVQKTIEQQKIFRITRKGNYAKIVTACRYYYIYVRDGLYENDKSPDVLRESKKSTPVVATTHSVNSISESSDVETNEVTISNNSTEAVTEAKHINLENMVREVLRKETERNNYGTTIAFLQGQIRSGDRTRIKAILDGAEWAKLKFGRYFYVSPQAPVAEATDRVAVAPENSKMSIERTETDKRLLQKYPLVYKRLFFSLFKLTEAHPEGVSVADLYTHINRVGCPVVSVIEEILDNASWATTYGSNYIFSKEVVDHSVVINDEINVGTETRVDAVNMVEENFAEEIGLVDFNGANDLAYTRADRKLPIHLIRELELIDELLGKIKVNLANGSYDKAILVSDHGASRLAVIHETENLVEMASQGQHSGRCCPKNDVDIKPDNATDADDFWALANYDRFKGSRKANVEVHGGATLEEVVVPIIEISYIRSAIEVKLMPVDAPATFTGVPEILVSFRKKAAVKIFATQNLTDVSIEIDGHFYDAKTIDDNFYVVDAMPEIRRAKAYTVNVYACGNRVASDLPLCVKKESGSEKSIL